MREMFAATVAPAVAKAMGEPRDSFATAAIKCFPGAGESQLEEMLPDLIRRGRDAIIGRHHGSRKPRSTLRITRQQCPTRSRMP